MRSIGYTLPAPIGGLNGRDPLEAMPESDAVVLTNWFPDGAAVTTRKGYEEHCTGLGGPVETLVEYSAADGSRALIAAADGEIWDASTTTPASLDSGFTNNRWQSANFRDSSDTSKLIMVNGEDTPQQYDGATLSDAVYAVIPDPKTLIDVLTFKDRLYFIEKDSTNMWYGGLRASSGNLTKYPLGSFLYKGGYLEWIASWTRDSGTGANDLLVLMSNMGEVLIFSGLDPGDAGWRLEIRFYLPPPMGRRSKLNFSSDLIVITEEGAFKLSDILQGDPIPNSYTAFTNKVNNSFSDFARDYKDNFGWEAVLYSRGHANYFNIPITANQSIQLVNNTLTGAWCCFKGMNALSWAVFDSDLYFGDSSGAIYLADFGLDDNGGFIQTELKTAFSFLNLRGQQKKIHMVRPNLLVAGTVDVGVAVDTDFKNTAAFSTSTILAEGAEWDEAEWDMAEWAEPSTYYAAWRHVNAYGRNAAVKLNINVRGQQVSLSTLNVIFETGGIFT